MILLAKLTDIFERKKFHTNVIFLVLVRIAHGSSFLVSDLGNLLTLLTKKRG